MTSSVLRLSLVAFALALLAAPISAQEQGAPQQRPPGAPAEADLIFEREVFDYPTFARRNPFAPLVGNDAGPRFEDIALKGIILSDDPRQSVVLMGLRQRAQQQVQQQVQQQQQAQQEGTIPIDTIVVREVTQRLRVGERWGNVQVVEILRDHVIVNVNEFGVVERRTLTMPTRRQGGL